MFKLNELVTGISPDHYGITHSGAIMIIREDQRVGMYIDVRVIYNVNGNSPSVTTFTVDPQYFRLISPKKALEMIPKKDQLSFLLRLMRMKHVKRKEIH